MSCLECQQLSSAYVLRISYHAPWKIIASHMMSWCTVTCVVASHLTSWWTVTCVAASHLTSWCTVTCVVASHMTCWCTVTCFVSFLYNKQRCYSFCSTFHVSNTKKEMIIGKMETKTKRGTIQQQHWLQTCKQSHSLNSRKNPNFKSDILI
jgi:hypothetical protein